MNAEINFRELRNNLQPEDIKRILAKYGVAPHYENEKIIIYPTVCHNLDGGSNKLYYYKSTKLFRCYTECNSSFDIFELIQKMEYLRGNEINLFAAISICDLQPSSFINKQQGYNTQNDINVLYNLLNINQNIIKLPTLDKNILDRFVFDKNALQIWSSENISYETMQKFHIKYDPIENCIIIPNFDFDGDLISIRGRFLNEDAAAKYKPICYNGKVLSHPSSLSLYGIFENKENIGSIKKVILFEGEKSVMKFEDCYPNCNYSLATLGKNISNQQIQLLLSLGVEEVILAYDADYVEYNEMVAKRNEYIKIAKSLKNYFNVCILMDLDMNLLGYKDSPIDKSKEVFEKIYKNRIYI